MGIPGLLPFVKKASKNSHIKHFKGCTVAVDAYGWLYKGAFGCAAKIGQGEETDVYVKYCMKYVNVLRSYGLKPILVLDGRNLPSKALTDAKRRENRVKNKAKAKEALRRGNKKEAWEYFTRCIEITPAMARELIKVLRQEKIDYIIAPYEADAQLTYLAKSGIADLVLTEDSDLIVFGCPKIFFKMSLNGDGVFFDNSKLNKCIDQPPDQFSFERFRQLCILSGCDYLASLPGIGLGRAKKVFSMSINPDIKRVLKQIPIILKMDLKVPEEYVQEFIQAEQTFLYQLVFDPRTRTLQPLTPYPANLDPDQLQFAGTYENDELTLDLCLGNVDLHTLKRVPDFSFDPCDAKSGYPHTSMWSENFKIIKRQNPIVEMRSTTKHTSTVGKKASVSLAITGIPSRRSARVAVKVEEVTTELNDEEIISMYSNGTVKRTVNTKVEAKIRKTSSVHDEDFVDEYSSRSKRRCMTSVYKYEKDSSAEIDEADIENSCEGTEDEGEDDGENPIPVNIRKTEKIAANTNSNRNLRPRTKNVNPFVKTSSPKKIPRIFSKLNLSAAPSSDDERKTPVCLIRKNTIYNYVDDPRVIVKSQYFRSEETYSKKITLNNTAQAKAIN